MNEIERNLGEQPIAGILARHGVSSQDVVGASTEHITHKMIARACKGRRLTPHVQKKILTAVNTASQQAYMLNDLFSY